MRIVRHIRASRASVYAALLDSEMVKQWKVPDGMTCFVHTFEAKVGGRIRISLTHETPTGSGKTSAHTDTYCGRFLTLVPNEKIIEVDEFETTNPAFQGEMTITIKLFDKIDGTELIAVHDGLPSGISSADNRLGWQMALNKLAKLVETKPQE